MSDSSPSPRSGEPTEFRESDCDILPEKQPHGGQHVGVVSSAVRIVHRPTGLSVTSREHRSQLRNKNAAMEQLRALVDGPRSGNAPTAPTPGTNTHFQQRSSASIANDGLAHPERTCGHGAPPFTECSLCNADADDEFGFSDVMLLRETARDVVANVEDGSFRAAAERHANELTNLADRLEGHLYRYIATGQTASRSSSNSFGKSQGAVVDHSHDERREEAPVPTPATLAAAASRSEDDATGGSTSGALPGADGISGHDARATGGQDQSAGTAASHGAPPAEPTPRAHHYVPVAQLIREYGFDNPSDEVQHQRLDELAVPASPAEPTPDGCTCDIPGPDHINSAPMCNVHPAPAGITPEADAKPYEDGTREAARLVIMTGAYEAEDCPDCDGCGWYEGGPFLQTRCDRCKGTGYVESHRGETT